ncbi:MAG: hypothetical protein IPO08_23615 [Xanthomonadales bacterium]|nr:hypothetical protein [Xanthomonadales bacterium]
MRISGNSRASLMAAMAIAMMGACHAIAESVPLRHAGSGNNRRPTPPRSDTALAREIAEHNEAVERRKADKKARKLGR